MFLEAFTSIIIPFEFKPLLGSLYTPNILKKDKEVVEFIDWRAERIKWLERKAYAQGGRMEKEQ